HEYAARGEAAFTPRQPSREQALEARIAELERDCGRLSLELATIKQGSHWPQSRNGTRCSTPRWPRLRLCRPATPVPCSTSADLGTTPAPKRSDGGSATWHCGMRSSSSCLPFPAMAIGA